jgi:hypothetical protein
MRILPILQEGAGLVRKSLCNGDSVKEHCV